jgi:hypothetical protein
MIRCAFYGKGLMDLFLAIIKICLHEVQMIANFFHRQIPASRPIDLIYLYHLQVSLGDRSSLLAEVKAFFAVPCKG